MRVVWILMSFASLLGGCGLSDRFDSPESRINAAMPLAPAVLAAKLLLASQTEGASAAGKDLEAQWDSRLRVRALTCARGYTPRWHESLASVKTRLSGDACFAQADEGLKRWLGLQRVRLLLAQEPASTLPAGGVPANYSHPEPILAVWSAARAPVVLVRGPSGVEAVDLVSRKSLFKDKLGGGPPRLSPNGRLFSAYESDKLVIRAVQGGEVLVELANSFDLDWLDASVVALRSHNPSGLRLLDLASGEEAPIPGANPAQAVVAVQVPNEGQRFNLVGRNGVQQFALRSGPGRHEAQMLASRSFPQEQTLSMNLGGASSDGSLWLDVRTQSQLRVINMATLEVSIVDLDPLGVFAVWPLAAADSFLLATNLHEGASQGSGDGLLMYVHGAGTLAAVPKDQLTGMLPVYLAGLKHLALVLGNDLRFVQSLSTAAARPLAEVVNVQIDAMNQRRLAQAQQAAADASLLLRGTAAHPMMAAPSHTFSAESRTVTMGGQRSGRGPTLTGNKAEPPLLAALPGLMYGAHVEALGVAAGQGAAGSGGAVDVQVRRTPQRLVLVLSSRDAVQWRLNLAPGARLAAVLRSGHPGAAVEGQGSAPVISLGPAWTHVQGDEGYVRVEQYLRNMLGQGIQGFQGKMQGSSFTVGE